jgi:uncharacterized membrane protein YphA (DoxX/SURF4 family)
MILDTQTQPGLRSEQRLFRHSVTTMRILLGLFFVLSGIANYLYFNAPGGFFETVTQLKLKLWGWGFEGIGPLPPFLAYPYAYLLPMTEMVVGVLFMINRFVRWAGVVMMLMLLSFILAFGLIGPDGLIPNNQGNWDKNVFMLLGAWICAAYDHYLVVRREKSGDL